jgi:hypothetical protein
MIRLLVKLGSWLDKRFPEAVTVKKEDFVLLLTRMRTMEERSAHVDAVKQVVLEMQKLKDEVASFKTSLGINGSAQSSPVAGAYLNDLPVGVYDDNQR